MKSTAQALSTSMLYVLLAVGGTANACAQDSGHPVVVQQPPAVVETDNSDLTATPVCGPLFDADPFWQPPVNGAASPDEPTGTEPKPGTMSLYHFGP